MEAVINHAKDADIFVIIGTSLQVQPAANILKYVHREVPKFIIDPHLTSMPANFTHIKEVATKGLERLVELLALL